MSLILTFRNFIWETRRAIRHDAFERKREMWLCDCVNETVESMTELLEFWGFELNHIMQFEDEGQVLSGRKKFENGKHQIHIRFFKIGDGLEVRAHREFTPEYSPIRHVLGIGCTTGCDWFQRLYTETKAFRGE